MIARQKKTHLIQSHDVEEAKWIIENCAIIILKMIFGYFRMHVETEMVSFRTNAWIIIHFSFELLTMSFESFIEQILRVSFMLEMLKNKSCLTVRKLYLH